MVAPGVLSAMETLMLDAKLVPLTGLKVGVAAGDCKVYEAEATALEAKPLPAAMALTVVAAVMVMGPEYT